VVPKVTEMDSSKKCRFISSFPDTLSLLRFTVNPYVNAELLGVTVKVSEACSKKIWYLELENACEDVTAR